MNNKDKLACESSSKRVLLINDHIHFGGGGDAALMLERRILDDAGHRTFTFSISSVVPKNARDSDHIFLESTSRLKNKLGKFVGCNQIYKQLKLLLDEIRPDLIRLHLLSKYPADIYRALEGYSVIQTLHGPNLFCATSWGAIKSDSSECEQGIGVKCMARGCIKAQELPLHINLNRRQNALAKKNVNLFLSPSHQLAGTAASLGFTPVRYFPLAIDPEFEILKDVERYTTPSILFVGGLSDQKGVRVLFDAFVKVVEEIPEARLIIAGKGKLTEYIKQQSDALRLNNNIKLMGFVGRTELLELYMRVHVLAVPSIWREQFGLVGPEALACKTPCVGSDIGGIPEWLHDNMSGFLVPPRDVDALAGKLTLLLNDELLRLKFGEYGRNFVLENYNPRSYKRNILGLLEEFTGNSQ